MKCCLDFINRMVLRVLTMTDGPQTDRQPARQADWLIHSFTHVVATSEVTVKAGVEQQSQRRRRVWA